MFCSAIKTILKALLTFWVVCGILIENWIKSVDLKHLGKGTLYFSILDVLYLVSAHNGDTLDGFPQAIQIIAIAFGCQIELDG